MNVRGSACILVLATILGFILSLGIFVRAWAQLNDEGVIIDGFTFFIPYPTEMLDDQFDVGYAGANLIGDDIETTISIAVHRTVSIIFYDHW